MRPAQATAVFAVDQITDMLFFLSALASIGLYALSHTIDLRLGWMLAVPALLLIIGFGLLAALGKHHRRLLKTSGRLLRWLKVRHRSRVKLARGLIHFRHALVETLALPRLTLSLIFLLCCAHWLLRYSILYLAVSGLGQDIDWSWTFIVQMLAGSGPADAAARRCWRRGAVLHCPAQPDNRRRQCRGGRGDLASGDLLFLPDRRRSCVLRDGGTQHAGKLAQASLGDHMTGRPSSGSYSS